jgi:uncharacterized membrane protein YagU involved in acid resistance
MSNLDTIHLNIQGASMYIDIGLYTCKSTDFLNHTMSEFFPKLRFRRIIATACIAGTLDIVIAIALYAVIQEKTTATKLLQSIASGILGKDAYSGGLKTAVLGLGLHYCITTLFTTTYFLAASRVKPLGTRWLIAGIGYGIFIWLVMNLIVLPVTFGRMQPMSISSVTPALLIVIGSVGIPISYLVSRSLHK